jgi:hypothetical protein
MTTVAHGPALTWAAAHRAVLFLLVLAVAVVAAVTVVLLVRAADDPATGAVTPAAPAGTEEQACADDLPMTGAFC